MLMRDSNYREGYKIKQQTNKQTKSKHISCYLGPIRRKTREITGVLIASFQSNSAPEVCFNFLGCCCSTQCLSCFALVCWWHGSSCIWRILSWILVQSQLCRLGESSNRPSNEDKQQLGIAQCSVMSVPWRSRPKIITFNQPVEQLS